MTAQTGLRERKKARTREALIEVALRLFRDQGYEATTVDQIAAEADVSRRTFFRYFPSKESIAFPHFEERREQFRRLAASRAPGETRLEVVRRAVRGIAIEMTRTRGEEVAQHHMVLASPTLMASERVLDRQWEDVIAEALGADRGTEEQRRLARWSAGAVFGLLRAALRDWLEGGAHEDLGALADQALDLLETGVLR